MLYKSLIFEFAIINMYYFCNQGEKNMKRTISKISLSYPMNLCSYRLNCLPEDPNTIGEKFWIKSSLS